MAPQYLYNVYTQTILFSTILGRVCDEMELRLAALIGYLCYYGHTRYDSSSVSSRVRQVVGLGLYELLGVRAYP